jgi:hypothetical protein
MSLLRQVPRQLPVRRSTGFAGQAGATANLKLTFDPDHSVGANHREPNAAGEAAASGDVDSAISSK